VAGALYRSFQKTGVREEIERFGYFLHAVAHKGGELLIRQQGVRMSEQKYQEIRSAGVLNERSVQKKAPDPFGLVFVVNCFGHSLHLGFRTLLPC
jgi:hypothetical protein